MSVDRIADLISRAKDVASTETSNHADASAQRAKLASIAAEFESMLLGQMLKEMRQAGKWDHEDEGNDSLGAGPFFDTIDVELASRLSKTGAFGLSQELLKGFEKNFPGVAKIADPVRLKADATYDYAPASAYVVSGLSRTDSPDDEDSIASEALDELAGINPALAKTVTSNFGWRRDPLNGTQRFHNGVDLRAAYGEDVKAAAAGTVVFEGTQGGYGTTVVLEHDNGIRTRYAHLSAADVSQGQTVTAGQVIGRAGHSGRTTGTHLHFEVTADGRPIDPGQWDPALAAALKLDQQVADLRLGDTGRTVSRGEHHED